MRFYTTPFFSPLTKITCTCIIGAGSGDGEAPQLAYRLDDAWVCACTNLCILPLPLGHLGEAGVASLVYLCEDIEFSNTVFRDAPNLLKRVYLILDTTKKSMPDASFVGFISYPTPPILAPNYP